MPTAQVICYLALARFWYLAQEKENELKPLTIQLLDFKVSFTCPHLLCSYSVLL